MVLQKTRNQTFLFQIALTLYFVTLQICISSLYTVQLLLSLTNVDFKFNCSGNIITAFSNTIISLLYVELCGTPGYLSPEVLQCSMFADAPGYGKEVDM